MKLLILGHKYQYEALKLTQIFFPNERIELCFERTKGAGDEAVIATELAGTRIKVSFAQAQTLVAREGARGEAAAGELSLVSLLFEVLTAVTGYVPKWGLLTGVRPSKLFRSLKERLGEDGAKRTFAERCFVSPEKTALTAGVVAAQESVLRSVPENGACLYAAIPFCPSRCSYCSFVSHSVQSAAAAGLVPEYVRLLSLELQRIGELARSLGLRLEAVYFGGGTPTTLRAEELQSLLSAIAESFDLSAVREYTVEAGRPDTITAEKLKILLRAGVTRISVNPQTFNDEVLRAVGRGHGAALTEGKFLLARSLGFDNINMDLIAGLPGEDAESFFRSVEKVLSLSPENVTVHTLALKRASDLGMQGGGVQSEKGALAGRMLDFAYNSLTGADYFPYYLYRQSRTLGNLENVGYCRPGRECLYNILMMEESRTVLGAGAGAVTRLRRPGTGELGRIFNFKYPYEYIGRFDELMERKNAIPSFFETGRMVSCQT